MIKRKLKILSLLCLSLVMTLGMTKIPVSATETITPENDFIIDASGTITSYTGSASDVNIPSTINGVNVTAIGSNAFNGKNMISIIIPEGVTSIGTSAFQNCQSLQSIILPNNLTKISYMMFYKCKTLEMITLPKNLLTIESSAFSDCNALKNITIPESVTNIGDEAFSSCTSLENITIPNGVLSIGKSAFSNCYSLKNITLPKGLTSIEDRTFSGNILESITIPQNISNIGNYIFSKSPPFASEDTKLNTVLVMMDDADAPNINNTQLINKIEAQAHHSLNWYRGVIKPEINLKKTQINLYGHENVSFDLADIFEYQSTKIYQGITGTTEYTGTDIIIPEQYLIPNPTYSIVGTPTSRDTKLENGKLYIGKDETATNLKVKIKLGTLEKETNITQVPLHSISMKTLPKSSYMEGDKYNPTGLVITIKYDDGKIVDIEYNSVTKNEFTFNVEVITPSTTKQMVTYRGKQVEHNLTVTAKPIDEPQIPETPNIDVSQNPEPPINNKPQDTVNTPNNTDTPDKEINFHLNRTENGIIYDEFGNKVDKYGNIIQTTDQTSLFIYLGITILSGCAIIIMKKKQQN